LQFLGPIVILALALALRYLYKKNNNVEWMKKIIFIPNFSRTLVGHPITSCKFFLF
jgi:hypothetical protein